MSLDTCAATQVRRYANSATGGWRRGMTHMRCVCWSRKPIKGCCNRYSPGRGMNELQFADAARAIGGTASAFYHRLR